MNLAMFMAKNLKAQKKRRMCKISWELYFSWDIRDIFEPESICLDVQLSVVIISCDLVLKEFILKKLELWLSFDIITNHVQKTLYKNKFGKLIFGYLRAEEKNQNICAFFLRNI